MWGKFSYTVFEKFFGPFLGFVCTCTMNGLVYLLHKKSQTICTFNIGTTSLLGIVFTFIA